MGKRKQYIIKTLETCITNGGMVAESGGNH